MVALAPGQVTTDNAAPPPEHIVDTLIAERAPRLRRSALWPLAKPLLYRLLDYRTARQMADDIAGMGGREALDHVSRLLNVKFEATGLERVPRTGRLMIVCNHPTGLADGIAVYDALRSVRPDAVFYANSDAHRVAVRLDEVLIPVEWVETKRTRERTRLTLKMSQETFEAEGALVIFPAGLISRKRDGRLADPEWQPTPAAFARKYNAPVVPIHVAGPWSFLFHAFDGVSKELRDITLFHELLNKKGRTFRLTVGHPIAPEQLQGDPTEAIRRLKAYTEQVLPHAPDQPFG
jgi:putative hemolysin